VVVGSVSTARWHSGRSNLVRGVGPTTGKIILVGEAPGRDEVYAGQPFVGMAGQLQQQEGWTPVGIRRGEVRIENVVEERPEKNSIELLTPRAVAWWQLHLHKRLDKLIGTSSQGRVIAPTGNLALNTLLRNPLPLYNDTHKKKSGQWRVNKQTGIAWQSRIGLYRGSLLTYTTNSGVEVRMIPTTHPASFLYGNLGYQAWKGDWARIAEEVELGCPPVEEGVDSIAESGADVQAWLQQAEDWGTPIAVDLETAGPMLLCFSVAQDGKESLVVPLVDPADGMRAVKWGWFWLAKVCASQLPKVFHNGMFDVYLLRHHKLTVKRWLWDTLGMHHLLDPSDRHSLAYCASRDLRTVFWKEESKEVEVGPRGGLKRKTAHWDQFLRYCGKDSRGTIELFGIYWDRLAAAGLLDTYRTHYRAVMRASMDLSLTGFTVDEAERARLHSTAVSELERLRHEMTEAAGFPLTTGPRILKSGKPSKAKNQPKGGLSNPAIMKYFYDVQRIKAYHKGGKRTCDEVAIRRMQVRYPRKAGKVAQCILDFRYQEKLAQFTVPTRCDRDGRMRSLYRPLTITGRAKAQTPPTGVGTNLQNQPHPIRSMFTASDPDYLLCELDLSQAESRIVDGSSGDPRALELARTAPLELDQHRLMASEVLGKAMEEITKHERDNVGKRGRHATNYGMEGVRFSEVLIKETEGEVVLTPDECQAIINAVMEARPYIAKWQHWIRKQVINERRLSNSWGRHLLFTGRVIGKEDWKQGFAWGPQSEVGVHMNQRGWLPAWRAIRRESYHTRVVQQGHDAIILDGPCAEVWKLVQEIVPSLMAEREYPGIAGPWTLSMPVGMKLGFRWGAGMHEWKQAELVSRRAFREVWDAKQGKMAS
jgi:uracil-DNA glycosylase family 4